MKDISNWVIVYISNKWKSLIGFILVLLLIIIGINQLNIPYKPFAALFIVCLFTLFWVLKTGRLVLPSKKYTVVFCIKTDDSSDKYYRKILDKLRAELDTLNASRYFQLLEVAPDIIGNRTQAEHYRESQGIDLVIWGNADSETLEGKPVINFRLNFTVKLNPVLSSKLLLFSTDLFLLTGTKKWVISTENTLREEIRVSRSFKEACLFIVGIYLLTENRLEDAIKILTALRQVIPESEDESFRTQIQKRITNLFIEAYLLLAIEASQNKDFPKAKKYYLELDNFPIKKFRIYVNLAKIEYYLNNLDNALSYTRRAAAEESRHPVIYANYAFFRILGKKYNDALSWYKRIFLLSQVDLDIPSLLEFLQDRYGEDNKEYAYLFAIGLLNYRYFDKAKGLSDIKKFITRTSDLKQYEKMAAFSVEILEADKYRKTVKKRIPRKKK